MIKWGALTLLLMALGLVWSWLTHPSVDDTLRQAEATDVGAPPLTGCRGCDTVPLYCSCRERSEQ